MSFIGPRRKSLLIYIAREAFSQLTKCKLDEQFLTLNLQLVAAPPMYIKFQSSDKRSLKELYIEDSQHSTDKKYLHNY